MGYAYGLWRPRGGNNRNQSVHLMAKKNPESQSVETQPVVISGMLVGAIIAAIGGALFYFGGRYALSSGFEWMQMGGIFLLAVGVMIAFSGDMTRESAIEWIKSLGFAVGVALLIRWPIAEPYRIPSGSMLPTLYGEEGLMKGDRVFVNKWIYGVRWPFMNKRIWEGQAPQRWDIVVFKAVDPDAEHPTLVKRIVGMPGERLNIHDNRVWRVFRGEEKVPGPESLPEFDTDQAVQRKWPDGTIEIHVPLHIPDFMPAGERARFESLFRVLARIPRVTPLGTAALSECLVSECRQIPDYMLFGQRYTSNDPRMKYGVLSDDKYSVVPDGYYLLLGDNSGNSKDGRYFGFVPKDNLVGRVASIWWPPQRWRDFTGFSDTWWWKTLLGVLAVLTVIRLFFGRSFAVHADEGRSVEHVYVDFFGLGLRLPFTPWRLVNWGTLRHGAHVLYHANVAGQAEPVLLIGRIAGLPGESVRIENGELLVNDAPVPVQGLSGARFTANLAEAPYGRTRKKQYTQVPDGQYFILSDHDEANDPVDSRTIGWVSRKQLAGRPRFVWWPLLRIRRLR